MHQFRIALLGTVMLAFALCSVTLLGGCGSNEPTSVVEKSPEVTKAKMEEMQNGMMGTIQTKNKSKK